MAEGVSFRTSAFSAPGNKTTFDIKNDQPKTSSTQSSIQSTDTESIIPEFTRAEELAIKRASSSIAPVQRTETQDQIKEPGDFLSRWRPSADLMMSIEGTTGPKNTRNWDGDGIEVTQEGPQPQVRTISEHVRGSTPDSVASSGNLRIARGDGAHRDIDTRRLQSGAGGTQDRRPVNMAKSTRDFVNQLQFDSLEDIHVPDGMAVNGDIQLRSRISQNEMETPKPSRKKTHFLPKLTLMLVFVMTLIAGVVAAIVVVNKTRQEMPGPRGTIIADPISPAECPDQYFDLGEELRLSCKIAIDHEYRKALDVARYVNISRHNKISVPEKLPWSVKRNGSVVDYISGKKVTCSSEGFYNLTFLDENKTAIILNDHISLKISTKMASGLEVNFTQVQKSGDECNTTEFVATCLLSKDCHTYQPSFFRRIYGSEDSLDHYMKCVKSFTDMNGHTVNCSATFPENVLANDVFLGCRMTTNLDKTNTKSLEKDLNLPRCDVQKRCKEYTINYPAPFNCSQESYSMKQLINGSCDFDELTNCFQNRPIFKYYRNNYKQLSCNHFVNETIPVCRLAWCRNFNYIYKGEIPGAAICGSSYSESGFGK